MKHSTSLIVMGFLVVGMWYGIGYYHGWEAASQRSELSELRARFIAADEVLDTSTSSG